MTRYVLSLMVAMVLAMASAAHARTCNPAIPATAPDSRYTNHGDGTVTDKVTGLMWKWCAEGLSGADCGSGTVQYFAWPDALQQGQGSTYAGHSDWRLPDVKELASLVEERCYSPAINDALFPATPLGWFWSSSPFAGDSDGAWVVSFGYGGVYGYSRYGDDAVRLVRGGQWFGSWDDVPGTASATPAGGDWTTSPRSIDVSSNGATTIYFRMVNTYDGTTPPDPPVPSPWSNDGSISGASGTFQYYGNGGQLKKTKLRFVGCNSHGCGPASGVLNYTMDLRATAAGHGSVSNLGLSANPVTLGRDFGVNFSLTETTGNPKTYQKVAVAILQADDQLLFDCAVYDNITLSGHETWSDSAACQVYPTRPTGTYKAIVRGKLAGGSWFDFDTTGGKSNPVSFRAGTENPRTVAIGGRILDKAKNPVVNGWATLRAGGSFEQVLTDTNGNFSLQGSVGIGYSLDGEKAGACAGGGVGRTNNVTITPSMAGRPEYHTLTMQCADRSIPVIIIPGIMGSTKADMDDTCKVSDKDGCYPAMPASPAEASSYKILSPDVRGWLAPDEKDVAGRDALENALKAAGYHVEKLPWDWRVSTAEAAGRYLKTKIDQVKAARNVSYVHIVAHSQGGLVTRAYIQGLAKNENMQSIPYGNDIGTFIMLGTPNGGSANPYYMLEGGDPIRIDELLQETEASLYDITMFYSQTTNRLYKAYNGKNAIGFGSRNDYKVNRQDLLLFYVSRVKAARDLMAKDLLYCGDSAGDCQDKADTFNSGDTYSWLHAKLNDSASSGIKKLGKLGDPDPAKVQTYLLLSNSEKTINAIVVKKNDCYLSGDCSDDNRGTYQYGIPEKLYGYATASGDGTVEVNRARIPLGGKIDVSEFDAGPHAGLMKSFAPCVVHALNTGTTCTQANVVRPETAPVTRRAAAAAEAEAPNLTIRVDGNPQPYLIDPDELGSGVDTESGDIRQDIPGTEIMLLEGSSRIDVVSPGSGIYTLNLKGVSPDTYEVAIRYTDGDTISASRTVNGVYDAGEVVSFTFTLDPATEEIIRITPPLGMPANIKAGPVNGTTVLSWEAVAGAAGYRIYGKREEAAFFELLGTTTETSFDTATEWDESGAGEHWFYIVVAVDGEEAKSFFESSIDNRPIPRQLQVASAGSGAGLITSDPFGIDCGAACAAQFNSGVPVTLTAAPDATSSLTGWDGCTPDPDNGLICYVTMDTDKTVTATFDGADSTPPAEGQFGLWRENGQIALSWSGFVDSGSGLHDTVPYKLVRAEGATPPVDCAGPAVYEGAASSYDDATVENALGYGYRLCGYDKAGNGSAGLTAIAAPFLDADNDGIADDVDICPNDPDNDADNDGICGDVDGCPGFDDKADQDGDGVADGCDACPDDAGKSDSEGQCGCGNAETDTDLDGIADCVDDCPADPANDADKDGICGDVDNFPDEPIQPGDLNNDNAVNLSDAILALRAVGGLVSEAMPEADVNGDGRIGLAEAIYILRRMGE